MTHGYIAVGGRRVRDHWFRRGGKGKAHVQSTAFGYTGCGLAAFRDATADRYDRPLVDVPPEWGVCGLCRRSLGAASLFVGGVLP